jgi:hypothetical protein
MWMHGKMHFRRFSSAAEGNGTKVRNSEQQIGMHRVVGDRMVGSWSDMNQGSRPGKGTAFMVCRRPEELCPGGDRASVVAKKRVMPVESREPGRWKRERQNAGTTTPDNAGNGSTRGRNPSPMGLGRTNGLDRAHVGDPGDGD